jgi:outer membrane protein assembly factor BamB
MRSLKTIAHLLFSTLLLLTLSCSIVRDKSMVKGEITSIAEGDGGEGTIIRIDKGSVDGIEMNQQGRVIDRGDIIATIMVDDLQSDSCRAVVLEHTPFKAVTEGLTVRFDVNGTILSPETLAPEKPCPDIPGPYIPTVGGNMARTGSYDEKGVPSPIGVLWKIRTDRWITHKLPSGEVLYPELSYSHLITKGLVFVRGGGFYAEEDMPNEEKYRMHQLMDNREEVATIFNGAIYAPGISRLIAYNIKEGIERWRFEAEVSCPAVSDGLVIFMTYDEGIVYALDTETGEEVWHIGETGEKLLYAWAIPAIVEDTAYFCNRDDYLYAVNTDSGEIKWRYYAGPSLMTRCVVVGSKAIYIENGEYLIVLDKTTSNEKWRFKVHAFLDISIPAATCDTVYFFSGCNLLALDSGNGLVKWYLDLCETGVEENHIPFDQPVVVGGIVYFCIDESVYAVDAETGKLIWSYKTEYETSTPVVVDGVLYVTSGPYLYAIK